MMKHPFEVGARFANRRGEYEVIDLNSTHMTIRYEDGELLETPIRLQKRIVENMRMEKGIQEQKARQKKKTRRRRASRYGRNFDGLDEADFQDSVVGTSWRARTGLGGLLARKLTELSGRPFESRAVPRKPQVYVVQTQAYDPDHSHSQAKFRFSLDEEKATHGLFVEKDGVAVDEGWDWVRLLGALKEKETLREVLTHTMDQHDLQWSIRVLDQNEALEMAARVAVDSKALNLRNGKGSAEPIEWQRFIDLLESIDDGHHCNLHLRQFIPKDKAIELEEDLAEQVATVWNGLLPLYTACTTQG